MEILRLRNLHFEILDRPCGLNLIYLLRVPIGMK